MRAKELLNNRQGLAEDSLNEFAPAPGGRNDGDGDSKFIPWLVFVKGIAYLLKDNFTLQMTQQPRQVKARFVPIDPMEYGPSQVYAYDDPKLAYDGQKRGVGISGMMHVGKYSKGHDGKLLTGYYSQELDGNKWIQFTLANIPKVAAIIAGNKEGALQQDVAEAISWSALDDGLSLEDKMTIFEEYAIRGNLTESIDQDKKDYFISLFELSNAPVKNKKYIVAPLALVSNRIMPLDTPSIMKFIAQNHNGLVFATADGKKTYPSKTLRDLSIFNTFTFASRSAYDKFRTALSLKFDIGLPSIGQEQGVAEAWSENYKSSINCKNPRGFSQRAHCQGRKKKQVNEQAADEKVRAFMQMFDQFKQFVQDYLELNTLPKISIKSQISGGDQPTFGRYNNQTHTLEVALANRHPVDILRTVAHELVHYKQHQVKSADEISGETGSRDENQANAVAGVIMRRWGKEHPELFSEKPMTLEENFADGRNPGRQGLSRRVGIPKKATLGQLEKIAKSSTGERRKMAQWQLNMRRGRKKK